MTRAEQVLIWAILTLVFVVIVYAMIGEVTQ